MCYSCVISDRKKLKQDKGLLLSESVKNRLGTVNSGKVWEQIPLSRCATSFSFPIIRSFWDIIRGKSKVWEVKVNANFANEYLLRHRFAKKKTELNRYALQNCHVSTKKWRNLGWSDCWWGRWWEAMTERKMRRGRKGSIRNKMKYAQLR